jgi:hypothetical protein
MLMVLVQSIIRRLPNSLYPGGKNPLQQHRCKCSLLKVRKGKYKGEYGGPRWSLLAKSVFFHSLGVFKTYKNLWEGENQVIPIQ